MINNPDVHPNAAMNRWIAAILVFSLKLVQSQENPFTARRDYQEEGEVRRMMRRMEEMLKNGWRTY